MQWHAGKAETTRPTISFIHCTHITHTKTLTRFVKKKKIQLPVTVTHLPSLFIIIIIETYSREPVVSSSFVVRGVDYSTVVEKGKKSSLRYR